MNDDEVNRLRASLAAHHGMAIHGPHWNPDSKTCRRVSRIGPGPKPTDPSDVPEPGPCAYLCGGHAGDYVALDNCGLHEFVILSPIP